MLGKEMAIVNTRGIVVSTNGVRQSLVQVHMNEIPTGPESTRGGVGDEEEPVQGLGNG